MKREVKRRIFSSVMLLCALMTIGLCEDCFAGALVSVVIFTLLAFIGQASGVWDYE